MKPWFVAAGSAAVRIIAPVLGGTVTLVTPPSTTIQVDHSGVYFGDLSLTVSDVTVSGGAQTTPVPATLSPSSQKIRGDGLAPIRKDDSVNVTVPVLIGTVTSSVVVEVYISDAGQAAVQSD